ncbi:PREDICTED: uncharacterized protein LOC106923279 isoform X2 [Poecilia mexicana]|uniref:uncharacterized protein LOC106923279 isoform X2 n=1 Tax=Poecilia mexicana TaxID=48701 RepID=UPI00072DCB2F|nr:PREDICTED: uncharacterized protein LOC106923279 isoform X2 [Poecilia mexicana]
MKEQRGKQTPEQDALEHIVACKDKPFLEERFIDSFKGRGVFTKKTIKPSMFVVEYRGNKFSRGIRSEERGGDALNGFVFEFSWKGEQWCIDASKEDDTLGRLVNDNHISPNCEMRKVVCEGKPHLCLFAVEKISPGKEITYCYGESSYEWRSKEFYSGLTSLKRDGSPSSSTPRPKRSKKLEISYRDESSDNDDEQPGPSSAARESSPDLTSSFMEPSEEDSSDEHKSKKDYETSKPKQKRMKVSPTKDKFFTSKNHCFVCRKGIHKISRHLKKHAKEEPEIAEAFSFPPNSTERKRLLNILRNRGNFDHNQEVQRSNTGELKVKRRPKSGNMSSTSYMYCPYCKAMMTRSEMCHHVSNCLKTAISVNKSVINDTEELESVHSVPPDVKKILSGMGQDEVGLVIQNDHLLIQLAKSLCKKYRNDPSKEHSVQEKLKEVGTLLLDLNKKRILSFEDAIQSKKFSCIVNSVKNIVGFDPVMQTYSKRGLAFNLGNSLKRIAKIILNGENTSETMRSSAKIFLEMCEKEWGGLVLDTTFSSVKGQKVSCPAAIPFTRDVQAFHSYLERLSASATESLKTSDDPQVFNVLSRVTLTQISVLSKCTTEVSEMTLKSFEERADATTVLSKHFIKINILSKSGLNFAILLTSELTSTITLLISKRLACGVHEDNPFLFAKPDSSVTSHYHGSHCIKSFSSLCHAENPENLRAAHLCNHMARIFQILMENDELEHLRELVGHEIHTNKEYYQSPEAAVELAKISKLLLAVEKGTLDRFKGKSLGEVEIDDELESDGGQSSGGEDVEKSNEESGSPLQQCDVAEQLGGQLTPAVQDALEHIKAQRDKPFLQEKFIDSAKGRGVFTKESIEPSSFVVEFRGRISTCQESSEKQPGDLLNNYVFSFSWKGSNWCVDASADDGSLGRLVNDDHLDPNCSVVKITYEEKPHLCLFALKKISAGEEITFDYGGSLYSWRPQETNEDVNIPEKDLEKDPAFPIHEKLEDSAAESFSSAESSGDEYVCNEQPDSDDSFSEFELPEGASPTVEGDGSRSSSDDWDSDMPTKATSLTRKNYCYVCGRPQTKISRHLLTHRAEEPEIAEAFRMSRNSKERKKLLQKLRNRGNYNHNQEVLRTRKGKLKVRRKTNMSSIKNTATCIYCKVLFIRKNLWRHLQRCPMRISSPLEGKSGILALVASGLTEPENRSSGVRKILKKLKEDETASLVLKDPYLLRLARCLYYMKEGKSKDYEISRKLRQMGKLLATLKEKSIMSIEEALKPQNFNVVIEAVRKVSTMRKNINAKPLSTVIGYSLKKVADIKYAVAVSNRADSETIEEAKEFLKLCEKEWASNVPIRQAVQGAPTLSFIQDVQLLFKYIHNSVSSAVSILTKFQSPPVYTALLKGIFAYVGILSRNFTDILYVTLESFLQWSESQPQENADTKESLLDKVLSKRLVKINIVNQKNQNVVLSLTSELLSAITLLVEKRKQCGLPDGNPYLFGWPDKLSMNIYNWQRIISMFVSLCGAKGEKNLTCSLFRIHTARIFRILILNNEELSQLATLLGCDVQTESEFYQNPEAVGDIAKILVMLSAVETECPAMFQGKSMEEIEIPDELPAVMEYSRRASKASRQGDGGSPSSTKKKGKGSSKRSRDKKKQEDEEDQTEATHENNEVEKEPEQSSETQTNNQTTAAPSKQNESEIYFSDEDEDMNVDFNIDIDIDDDDDDVRKEGSKADDTEANVSCQDKTEEEEMSETRRDNSSEDTMGQKNNDDDVRKEGNKADDSEANADVQDKTEEVETMGQNEEANGEDDDDEQDGWMGAESGGSSPVRTEEKRSNFEAAMRSMKEIKILIRKLNIENLQIPVRVSRFPLSENQSAKGQLPPVAEDERQSTSTSTEETNKQRATKAVKMNCSHCRRIITKGQTAYQKKGFTDVFCSKDCLFEMFLPSRAAQRTCYYCFRENLQPLELIMAAVDLKGTVRDFCSTACLCSFRSSSPSLQRKFTTTSTQTLSSLCSACSKTCVSELELKVDERLHRFCSVVCLDAFCREKLGICENCSQSCRKKPLQLRLEDGSKTICGPDCLEEFKKNLMSAQECPMCRAAQLPSDMVCHKNKENAVDLFCSHYCVMSFKSLSAEDQNIRTSSVAVETDDKARLIIASDDGACCGCRKQLKRASAVYHLKKAKQLFCSEACVTKMLPHAQFDTKKCYSCFQLITQPQKVILAPVDDSGTMKELCSDSCLTSTKSKMLLSNCKLCGKHCPCKLSMTVDGEVHRLCSESCVSDFRIQNQSSWSSCAACGALRCRLRLALQTDGGVKTVCGDECLLKLKEKVKTLQLCSTCRTSHQMSDMVENQNSEGQLDLFCSHRCMKVHRAQTFTESKSEETDIKDVKDMKPSLASLPQIKEEPEDQEYFLSRSVSVSPQSIKEEPGAPKEDLKIGSVFSLTEDSKPPRPAPAHMEIQASCSTCQKVLLDGETVYQRKAHSDLFCSTSCLLRFHQLKSVKKTCHFCLREIVKLQSVLQAAVDDAGTKKDFCSQSCLSSFNYKRIMSTKPPVVPAGSRSQCSVCSRFCISKHEVIHQDVVQKVCSDSCYRRFCNINNLSVCENCGSRCSAPLSLKMEDGSKPLCGAECLKLLKQKIPPLQPCSMCCKSKLVSEMFENKTSEEVVELFCSSSCVTAAKIQAVCSSGVPVSCGSCRKMAAAACHLALSDASIRSFCCLTCAMTFKETHRDKLTRTGGAEPGGAAPQRRPCAQCQEAIKAAPRVIQRKDEVTFVCSLVCSKKFKKLNGILGVCERCRKKTVIHEVKRIDNKDCSFCSDGCLLLFHRDLDRKWGKHCSSCSYCLSVSRTVLSGPAGGRRREFCSEGCRSKYRTLISHEAICDTCGRRGKLAESLPLPGNVKYFCDLKCLLRFGKNEEEEQDEGSPPPEPAGSVASSPVITSVVSLSGGPAGQTAPLGLFSDIQAKVVGHASIQTAPRQLKNKSMLCVPLVHNKGASCCVQTVETASQTVNFKQKLRQVSSAVPVPVPVFVPLPMNLYSQLTPAPLVLPVPLPVPVFLPEEKKEEEKKKMKEEEEKKRPGSLQEDLICRPPGQTEEEKETQSLIETIDSYMDGLGSDYQPGFNHKDFESDCSLELFSQNQTCCVPPPEPDQNLHTGPDLPPPPAGPAGPNLQNSLDPPPAAGLGDEPQENIQNNLKAENEKLNLKVLDSRVGVDAWRKWIQWRESQTSLDLLPMAAGRSDILRCSSSELSDGLFLFIREAELPEEDSCPPDGLFFLCLSIQQYLFENRRVENIFTDQNYQKFSSELTRILKRSRPSMSVHRGVASRVEEEFLWECKQLGAYSPIVLLNTLLFFSCKYFGFTTVEQQRRLSFTNFTSCTRTDGETSVLRFYPPESRGDAETGAEEAAGSDGVPAKKRRLNENFLEMKENLQNPLRCPVRLYEFYLSKCSDSVRRRSDVFYLQPDRRCVPSSPLWFSLAPLDDATMEAAIVRSLAVRELTERDGGGV